MAFSNQQYHSAITLFTICYADREWIGNCKTAYEDVEREFPFYLSWQAQCLPREGVKVPVH